MTKEEATKIIKECKEKGFKYTFYTVEEYHTTLDMAVKALDKCDRIEKIINSYDADFIANYVRGLFVE